MLGLVACALCASVAWGFDVNVEEVEKDCANLEDLLNGVNDERCCKNIPKSQYSGPCSRELPGVFKERDEWACNEKRLESVRKKILKVRQEKRHPLFLVPACEGRPLDIAQEKEDSSLEGLLNRMREGLDR